MFSSGRGQPVSTLMLDVAVLDAMGQRVTAGMQLQQKQNTAIAATTMWAITLGKRSLHKCYVWRAFSPKRVQIVST